MREGLELMEREELENIDGGTNKKNTHTVRDFVETVVDIYDNIRNIMRGND